MAWVAGASLAAAIALAFATDAWAWRIAAPRSVGQVATLLLWFTWPAWPLALWTFWRWRRQLRRRHLSVPLGCAVLGIGASTAMASSDRADASPAGAGGPRRVCPADAGAPTAAAIDWFSVFFFSAAGIALWVIYASLQTGVPAKPAANVFKLAPGFVVDFSALAFVLALLGTMAWIGLVRWRTGRTRHPLWKSLVLPPAASCCAGCSR